MRALCGRGEESLLDVEHHEYLGWCWVIVAELHTNQCEGTEDTGQVTEPLRAHGLVT